MILDERDEGTLLQLAVSPLGRGGYLAHRMALPAPGGLGTGCIIIAAPIAACFVLIATDSSLDSDRMTGSSGITSRQQGLRALQHLGAP